MFWPRRRRRKVQSPNGERWPRRLSLSRLGGILASFALRERLLELGPRRACLRQQRRDVPTRDHRLRLDGWTKWRFWIAREKGIEVSARAFQERRVGDDVGFHPGELDLRSRHIEARASRGVARLVH